jgi:uroporphyrinogen decarboxylase
MRKPDFDNILKVLNLEAPDRPTLFEFFLNVDLYNKLAGRPEGSEVTMQTRIDAYHTAGYDYTTVISGFHFPRPERESDKSASLNDGSLFYNRETYEKFVWPEVDDADYSELGTLKVPPGMKLIGHGPGGVEENMIAMVGYDNLCMMLFDDPELVQEIAEQVGSRLVRHYERMAEFDNFGAMISNDDWGFQGQTMISPDDMRKYIIPWHKKIVEVIHGAGYPAILHSCGNLRPVMDDIIDVCGYNGKHSYEDKIQPVEEAYEEYYSRIAILGGIDVDFLCRKSLDEIKERSRAMLERSASRGAYALGSGNSIPYYVPSEAYMAMISVIND